MSPAEAHSAPAIVVLNQPSDVLEYAGKLSEYIARLQSACQSSGTALFILEDDHAAIYPVLRYYSRVFVLTGGDGMFGSCDKEGHQLFAFETHPDGTLAWKP